MAMPPDGALAPPRPTDPESRLLALHRDGSLADEYPRVRPLLAELTGAALVRAGHLLARLDPDDVLRRHPTTPTVRVGLTGHGTLAPLVPALTAELARHGLLLRPMATDFDGYVLALMDPDSALYEFGADLVACVLDPAVVMDELPTPWRLEDAARVLDEKVALVDRVATAFESAGRGTLVLNTIPLPYEVTAQLLDYGSRARLGALWRQANARLLGLAGQRPGVVVLDLDPLVAEGIPVTDARLSVYVRAHLSPGLLARYAREVGHLVRNATGHTKKVLALDLDGTVWGGILGEDGAEGIVVADGYRGAAFRQFQQAVKQIASQGVLLVAVSKNDPEPVRTVLREHPGMTLREPDFLRVAANWRPKHENILELAADLNVGPDSVVFVDDSPFECGLVRHTLPGVAVVRLGSEPALHVAALLRDGWFDTREITTDDLARASRYRDDLARANHRQGFDSIADYLRDLGVTVLLARAEPADAPRVAQLTLRTNQFNLTTRRLGAEAVRALADDPAALVLTIRSADRFGDNGLVGAVFLRQEVATIRIENFLLSCRVFGRGIEQACLAAVLRHAREHAAVEVLAGYRETAKNGNVRDFYPRAGFTTVAADGDGTVLFRHPLAGIPPVPEHVTLTESLGGKDR